MAPISLDEYRQNQPPRPRRAKSSPGAPSPAADDPEASRGSLPAGVSDREETAGDAPRPPRPGSRLTTSAEELYTETAPAPAADPYMSALLERQATTDSEARAQKVESDPDDDIDSTSPTTLDDQDRFFRELGHQAPQPVSSAPTALGSANLHPAARVASRASRARTPGRRTARDLPATSHKAGRRVVPRIAAIAGAGVVFLLIAGLAIANLGGSPTRRLALARTSGSTNQLKVFDAFASRMAAITIPANHLAGAQHPRRPSPRAHKPIHRHRHPRTHPASAPTTLSTATPATSSPSESGSSGAGSSSSGYTPAGSASTASGGSTGGSTSPIEHSTSPSPARQPAFGANGTLGPGSSPNG